ncbi:HAMP domain-containing protein [Tateyamaria sp.]|uniref:HAMP domain-containing protein n=1 Tax=Tateyamaria sp. TaxID=1929288 RepID=UPI0032A06253
MSKPDELSIGRFDKSFLIHMIKDFFIVLMAVSVLEFALKGANVYRIYSSDGESQARVVAEELAENVVSIMLNEGGPVAARTIYPILDQNWEDLGYEIGIVPSEVTVTSIEDAFGYTPEGVPISPVPDTRHKTAIVEIAANSFCLSCHTDADVGDVLGHIVVRNYLARDFLVWWEDIKVTLGLAIGKIVLHSFLLFLILRSRMEPLLRLRAVVSSLSKAYTNLNRRVEVKTADEFGVLARDLNVFLDRISLLVDELDLVLRRVVSVNDDIIQVQISLRDQIDTVVSKSRSLERGAMLTAKREPRLSSEWFDAMRKSIAELDAAMASVEGAPEAGSLVETLRSVVAGAEAQIEGSEQLYGELTVLGDEAEQLKNGIAEMTRLEERMKTVIETGSKLVSRLRPTPNAKSK